MMVWLLFIIDLMGLFFYNKIGSIISIGDLPTTNIIEPELEADIAPQKAIFLDLNEQVCQKLISESKLKEHIDEKRAMDYLRLIQDMFRSYYLTVSSDSSLPDLVSGYEHQLSQVLDMMIYGILEEDSSKKGEK